MTRASLGKCVAIVLALLGAPALASAKTVYVWAAASGGDGSLEHPYPTITQALAQMNAGDTCLVRAGTYREELNLDKPGITLAAYQDESVMVTGCDLVNLADGQTYKNPANGVECVRVKQDTKVYQLFADGKRMNIARWPDQTHSMLSMQDWEDSVVGKGDDKTATIPSLPDRGDDYWKGGVYVGMNEANYPKAALSTWYSATGEIASSSGKVLRLTRVGYGVGYKPFATGPGYGYILNCLGALDAANEWCWSDGYLYFKTPTRNVRGVGMRMTIEARTRLYVLNVLADNIKVTGINFMAGTVLVQGNQADIQNCTFRYLSPFVINEISADDDDSGARCNWGDYKTGTNGIAVLGNGMTMKDCYIAHSWWAGMVLWGDKNTVENCVIEDINWLSKRAAGINSFGADNVIRFCTIRNTGGTAIEGGNGGWLKKYAIRNLWEHNLLENVGLLGADSGGSFIYVNHQVGTNPKSDTEWRYNMCIHSRGPDKGKWGDMPSLYVDNNSSGYKVHHNVVIDAKVGLRYNDFIDGKGAGQDVYFYNNTLYKVSRGMAYGTRPGQKADAGVTVVNNLGFGVEGYGNQRDPRITDFGPTNIVDAQDDSVRDAANWDFEPTDPRYIDTGVIIPGIEMDYAGKAPDIGAYESGQPKWKFGATLKVPAQFQGEELPAPGAVVEKW